jgi:outer membrane protein
MTPRHLSLALALAIAPLAAHASDTNPGPNANSSAFSVTLGLGVIDSDATPLKGMQIATPSPNAHIDYDNDDTVLDGAITWHINDHWAIEGWVSQGAKHQVDIDVENAADPWLASYEARTMSLMAQYRFAPIAKRVTPFIGAGWQRTTVKDVSANAAVPQLDLLDIGNASGFALAGGVDVALNEHWFVRGDVRYFDGDARVGGTYVAQKDTAMDAVYYGASVGFRF